MQMLPNCQYHNLWNSVVLKLKQLPITCIYELKLRKTDGGLKVLVMTFKLELKAFMTSKIWKLSQALIAMAFVLTYEQ